MKFKIMWDYIAVAVAKVLLVLAGSILIWLALGTAPPHTISRFTAIVGLVIIALGIFSRFEDW
jgi:hypothetical protein